MYICIHVCIYTLIRIYAYVERVCVHACMGEHSLIYLGYATWRSQCSRASFILVQNLINNKDEMVLRAFGAQPHSPNSLRFYFYSL